MTVENAAGLLGVKGARVLVTGGAGFIGSHLVDHLIKGGAEQVVILDDLSRARPDWVEARKGCAQIRFIPGNILDHELLTAAMENVSVVYHLAAVSQVMKTEEAPEAAILINAIGTIRVADAACRAGVSRIVFASSREVYGDNVPLPVKETSPLNPKNIYGVSKIAAEIYLKSLKPSQIQAVVLRLSNVYGPGDRDRVIPLFIMHALQGAPLTIYGSNKALDFVWIGTVVEMFIQAGFGPTPLESAINIGSGKAVRLDQLADRICRLAHSPSPVQITSLREPEIESYQADIDLAARYWGLKAQDDPLANLAEVIAAYQECLSREQNADLPGSADAKG